MLLYGCSVQLVSERLLLTHKKTPGFLDSGEKNSIWGQRWGLMAQSFVYLELQASLPCPEESRTSPQDERLLLTPEKTPGFLASGGEEINSGPETKLDRSELLCNKVLLKCKGDRESFWHKHQKGAERVPPC